MSVESKTMFIGIAEGCRYFVSAKASCLLRCATATLVFEVGWSGMSARGHYDVKSPSTTFMVLRG